MIPSVTDELLRRVDERRHMGIRRYGQELTPDTDIDFLAEAIDEALDLAAYLVALRQRLEEK